MDLLKTLKQKLTIRRRGRSATSELPTSSSEDASALAAAAAAPASEPATSHTGPYYLTDIGQQRNRYS